MLQIFSEHHMYEITIHFQVDKNDIHNFKINTLIDKLRI